MTTELIKSKSRKAAVRNGLKGHDKSGTGKRAKLMFATPLIGKSPETSAGIRGKISAYPSSRDARNALVAMYKRMGYVLGSNNEMRRGDEPVLVIPKKSKMIRLKQGKGGRLMQSQRRSGIII